MCGICLQGGERSVCPLGISNEKAGHRRGRPTLRRRALLRARLRRVRRRALHRRVHRRRRGRGRLRRYDPSDYRPDTGERGSSISSQSPVHLASGRIQKPSGHWRTRQASQISRSSCRVMNSLRARFASACRHSQSRSARIHRAMVVGSRTVRRLRAPSRFLITHKAHVRENRSLSAEVCRPIRRAVPFSSRFCSLVMAQRGVFHDEGRTGRRLCVIRSRFGEVASASHAVSMIARTWVVQCTGSLRSAAGWRCSSSAARASASSSRRRSHPSARGWPTSSGSRL